MVPPPGGVAVEFQKARSRRLEPLGSSIRGRVMGRVCRTHPRPPETATRQGRPLRANRRNDTARTTVAKLQVGKQKGDAKIAEVRPGTGERKAANPNDQAVPEPQTVLTNHQKRNRDRLGGGDDFVREFECGHVSLSQPFTLAHSTPSGVEKFNGTLFPP